MMTINPKDIIFTEKYRPVVTGDICGSTIYKTVQRYIEAPKQLPSFIFYSVTPGTGKTSLAKAIVNEMNCDYIMINSSDDRTMEVVRDRIKEFCMTKSTKEGLKRIVIMDEADSMTTLAQNALRTLMETYANNASFIFTCNNMSKIIYPIHSRCICINFNNPEKEEIYQHIKSICDDENIDYTDAGVTLLVDINYPSIRNCVLALQDFKTMNKKLVPDNVTVSHNAFLVYWDELKVMHFDAAKKAVFEGKVNARELNKFFWQRAVDENLVKVIQYTCRNEKDISMGCDERVVFVSSLYEMKKEGIGL